MLLLSLYTKQKLSAKQNIELSCINLPTTNEQNVATKANQLANFPLSFLRTGHYNHSDGNVQNRTEYGVWWSSTRNSTKDSYYLSTDTKLVYPYANFDRGYGFAMRCVLGCGLHLYECSAFSGWVSYDIMQRMKPRKSDYEVIIPTKVRPLPDKYEMLVARILARKFQSDVRFVECGPTKTPDVQVVRPENTGKSRISKGMVSLRLRIILEKPPSNRATW